jgi:hypothetical protein
LGLKLFAESSGANNEGNQEAFPGRFPLKGESAMSMNLSKVVQIVAVFALACISPYSEAGGGGGGGGGLPKLPTKGTCGFLLTFNYPFVYLFDDPGDGWGMDALGTINFQTSTISVNIILQNHPLPSGSNFTESQLVITAPFTTVAGPIPGSFTITFALPDNSPFTFNLIPVNKGNTILMQGFNPNAGSQDASTTGRCEM